MSTMLEEAIVDAKALKEAAMKNAEALVIEKYAQEIKDAVNVLLEQEEEDAMGMADLSAPDAAGMGMDAEQGMHPSAHNIPDSFEGASDKPIEINLDELAAEVEQAMGEFESHEDAAEDVEAMALQEPPSGQEGVPEQPADAPAPEAAPLEEEQEVNEEEVNEEEIEINEEEILSLLEKMIADTAATKSGHMNRPEGELQYEEDLENARAASDVTEAEELEEEASEIEEENEALKERMEELEEENKIVASAGLKLRDENDKLREAFGTLQEKLEQVNVSNAKLLYINQTLTNASLNERQKQKIVEAISKTETVREAKVIFETLQSSVGISDDRERLPKSLSEAVSRKSSLIVAARQQKEKDNNSNGIFFDRMKKLAGLNN